MANEPVAKRHHPPVAADSATGRDSHPPADPEASQAHAARRRRTEPSVVAAVALGGALGVPARYALAEVIGVRAEGFPWATFWTNVSGSLALEFLLTGLLERFPPSRHLRPFVATGFLGAYTTYSTFAVETDLLVKDGRLTVALTYVAASLLTGFAAVWAGVWAARALPLRRRGGRG